MSAAWSAGWASRVALGPGQERTRTVLLGSIRHPSRSWHDLAPLRAHGRAPSTIHRHVHALAALGVIALQATLPQFGPRRSQGCHGGLRFTFGVRYWRRAPIRCPRYVTRNLSGRRIPSPGQIELSMPADHPPDRPAPMPAAVRFAPVAAAGTFDDLMVAAGVRKWW